CKESNVVAIAAIFLRRNSSRLTTTFCRVRDGRAMEAVRRLIVRSERRVRWARPGVADSHRIARQCRTCKPSRGESNVHALVTQRRLVADRGVTTFLLWLTQRLRRWRPGQRQLEERMQKDDHEAQPCRLTSIQAIKNSSPRSTVVEPLPLSTAMVAGTC